MLTTEQPDAGAEEFKDTAADLQPQASAYSSAWSEEAELCPTPSPEPEKADKALTQPLSPNEAHVVEPQASVLDTQNGDPALHNASGHVLDSSRSTSSSGTGCAQVDGSLGDESQSLLVDNPAEPASQHIAPVLGASIHNDQPVSSRPPPVPLSSISPLPHQVRGSTAAFHHHHRASSLSFGSLASDSQLESFGGDSGSDTDAASSSGTDDDADDGDGDRERQLAATRASDSVPSSTTSVFASAQPVQALPAVSADATQPTVDTLVTQQESKLDLRRLR